MNNDEQVGRAGFGSGAEGAAREAGQPFGGGPLGSGADWTAQTAAAAGPEGAPGTAPGAAPGPAPVAFCGNCGRPLGVETMRVVGAAAYCEPCLLARLGGAPVTPPSPAGWAPVPPAPLIGGEPNPGLAALLGLIPGVGAMYNGQYGKGIIHLIVFVALVQLSNWAEVFGLFVAGWIFYMAIEAHHTARARRDGTPLPNPFGLNDLGARLSLWLNWSSFAPTPGAMDAGDPAGRAMRETIVAQATRKAGFAPGATGYAPNPPVSPPSWAGVAAPFVVPIVPIVPTAPPEPAVGSRFPAGAVLLIGLGTLFLLHTSGLLRGFSPAAVVGLGLLGLGAWLFLRRLLSVPSPRSYAGEEPDTQLRVLQAVRDAGPVTLLGALNLLDGLHLWPWSRSWPFAIIFAGLLLLAHRAITNRLAISAAAERLQAYEAVSRASSTAASGTGSGAGSGTWTAGKPPSPPAPSSSLNEGGL